MSAARPVRGLKSAKPSPKNSSASRQRRRIMVLAPALGIGDVHLIAQHIPDSARFDARFKSLHDAHVLKHGELLVAGKAAAIAAAEYLLKQLPEFPFAHNTSVPPLNMNLTSAIHEFYAYAIPRCCIPILDGSVRLQRSASRHSASHTRKTRHPRMAGLK